MSGLYGVDVGWPLDELILNSSSDLLSPIEISPQQKLSIVRRQGGKIVDFFLAIKLESTATCAFG